MALLASYTNAGIACFANGTNCFAHSLPTTPDWAEPVPLGLAGTTAAASLPLHLITRGTTMVAVCNPNPGMGGELVSKFEHSLVR